ncbi:hypothetical protein FRC00_010480, partial [Tulasnella sp. 408]
MQAYGNTREDLNNRDFPSSADLSNICDGAISEGDPENFWLSEDRNQDTTRPPIPTLSAPPPTHPQPPREQNQVQDEQTGAWPVQLPLQNLPASEPSPLSTILDSPWPPSPASLPSPLTPSQQDMGIQALGYASQLDWSFNQAFATVGTGEPYGVPIPCTHAVPLDQVFNSLRLLGVNPDELDALALAQLLTYCIPPELATLLGYFWEGPTSTSALAAPCGLVPQTHPPESGPNHFIGTAGHPVSPPRQDHFLAADGGLTQRGFHPPLQIRFDRHCDPSVIPEHESSPSTTAIGSAQSSPFNVMEHSPSPGASPLNSTLDPGSPVELQCGNAHSGQSSNVKNPGCRCGRTFKDEKQHWRN